jgi:hypothetical protein
MQIKYPCQRDVQMKRFMAIALLALLMLPISSMTVYADEGESNGDEKEDGNEADEKENQLPGFEAVIAIACFLGAARSLGKAA